MKNLTQNEENEAENNQNRQDEVPVDEPTKSKDYDFTGINGQYQALFVDKITDEQLKHHLTLNLQRLQTKHNLLNYNVLVLFDEHTSLSSSDADRIYNAITNQTEKKDILLLLNSRGGRIEPAYLISQTCKKNSNSKFVISIPRKAKSAATLICLGADEIHMGLMSEIGPIDPQINNLPALGLGNSLEYIAKIVCKYPDASEMFSNYLSKKLELSVLGYFERVSESATQYAERLIGDKILPDQQNPKSVAEKLVYHYKDHSFVIDIDEAKSLLGEGIIKENSAEYYFGNEVYIMFDLLNFMTMHLKNKKLTFVGDLANGLNLINNDK